MNGHRTPTWQATHPADRNATLLCALFVWCGIIMGFGPGIVRHFAAHEAPYPLILHAHAAAFVGWLVLLTTQVLLVRVDRLDLHRRLGRVGVALAAIMVVVGPAIAIYSQQRRLGTPDSDPPFLIIPLTDILAFATLVAAAVAARRVPSAHKRLMLLATIYISDAGFGRWLGGRIVAMAGDGFPGLMLATYGATDLLMLSIGVYDLVTRRRLHRAYGVAMLWILAIEITARTLYLSPAWRPWALRLLGQ